MGASRNRRPAAPAATRAAAGAGDLPQSRFTRWRLSVADGWPAAVPGVKAAVVGAAVQGLVLVALAVYLVVAFATGDASGWFGAVGGAVLALVGAAVLIGAAAPLLHGRRWARTPVLVLNVLWLPVGYSLGFQAGRPEVGVPMLFLALAVLASFVSSTSYYD